MNFGLKCCSCHDGAIIDKWVNTTQVRKAVEEGVVNADPYPRPVPWLAGGDLNGLPAQLVEDAVDDIVACAGGDSTHVTKDHNCYDKSGTVDMTVKKRLGGQWVLARKYWHGIFGPVDRVDPNRPTGVTFDAGTVAGGHSGFTGIVTTFQTTPPQTHYLQMEVGVSTSRRRFQKISGSYNYDITTETDHDCTGSVASTTGIQSQSGSYSGSDSEDSFNAVGDDGISRFVWLAGLDLQGAYERFAAFNMEPGLDHPNAYYAGSGSTYELHSGAFTVDVDDGMGGTTTITVPDYVIESIVISGTSFSRTIQQMLLTADGGGVVNTPAVFITLEESLDVGNTSVSYGFDDYNEWGLNTNTANFEQSNRLHVEATVNFSVEYTAANVCEHFNLALNEWNMTDWNLAGLRQDEELANAPLIVYDEVGPTQPVVSSETITQENLSGDFPHMDDYATGLVDDAFGNHPGADGYSTTWAQTGWHDPNDYIWTFDGSVNGLPGGWTGGAGAVLHTGLRSGAIIAHTQAGSERHFWFKYVKLDRIPPGDGHPVATWGPDDNPNGDFSPAHLPTVTMRWMDNLEAQYDAELATPNIGNFPQSFLKQVGGVLTGAKFVCATHKWPSVNFARPCGGDRFAVDQTTVCCIVTTVDTGEWVVHTTGEAVEPLAPGGLASGDYVAADGQVWNIISIDDDGTVTVGDNTYHQFTVHADLIEEIPEGIDPADGIVGRLRWPDAPETCAAYDTRPRHTGVHIVWTFDHRKASDAWATAGETVPTWYAGVTGCLSGTITQFSFTGNVCDPMVGTVPYDEDDESVETLDAGGSFKMPDSIAFDYTYGAHWQAAIMLTMPDPFWQRPYKPDCDFSSFAWTEDDGSGHDPDTEDPPIKYFAHHPVVEALSTIPGGQSLPDGVTLFFDPDHHEIAPPQYPNGIPIGDGDGGYGSVDTDWGFLMRACANIGGSGRFSGDYLKFVTC